MCKHRVGIAFDKKDNKIKMITHAEHDKDDGLSARKLSKDQQEVIVSLSSFMWIQDVY